ncbi:hypothetical protein BCR44DRAFT_1278049 [Catenaria anguillulae PL171]|uniref:Aminoglycoside phosphotransferase domain-containing protein n=1 Tax=Catenaria anguillulae PL171 TaxID=765915 RepID=A0A1Y2H981_9FUNG|nr:hypothetical protein BCR44DRAFT_1278049 [Catenaria anguillulae PL171]
MGQSTAHDSDARQHGPPRLGWRSAGAQELLAIDQQPGVVLKALWPHLQAEHRLSVVNQLAHIVCRMKSSPAASGLVAQGAIGNFSVRQGPVARADGPPKLNDITLGCMVDGGRGPWFPTSAGTPPVLLQYIRDTTHAAVTTLRSPALDVLAGMRTRFAPRIDAYIAALDSIGSPNATPSSLLPNDLATWAAVPLSLTHGDLNLQNVIVTIDGITDSLHPSPTDPFALDLDAAAPVLASLKSLDPATHKLRITSILDWEWAGVFPWTDEFRASFDFLATPEVEGESLALRNAFYDILDASGMPTPSHTHQAVWTWLSGVSLVRDTLAPWWMRDLVDPGAEEHNESKRVCEDELDQALSAVGY